MSTKISTLNLDAPAAETAAKTAEANPAPAAEKPAYATATRGASACSLARAGLLLDAFVCEDSSALLAAHLRGHKVLVIAGLRAFAAAAPRLGCAEEFAARSAEAAAALNTARALDFGHLQVFFSALPERAQAAAIAAAACAPSLVLAIGGGVVCDVAKVAASALNLPLLCLPTICATCAAASGLSVLYQGAEFAEFADFTGPSMAMIADLGILRAAPRRYLLAGLGDSMAKFFESSLQQRGAALGYFDHLGAQIAQLCRSLLDADPAADFEQIAMINLHATALVSRLIEPAHNGALAHAACYALHAQGATGLHGELVAFGLLVQAAVFGDEALWARTDECLARLNMPRRLGDFMRADAYDAGKFADFVLAAEDAQALLAAGKLAPEQVHAAAAALAQW